MKLCAQYLLLCLSLILPGLVLAQEKPTLELSGDMTQGGMIKGKVTPGTKVSLNGESLAVSAEGYFVFGFGRDAKLEHSLQLSADNAVQYTEKLKLKKRHYKIQKIEGIAKKIMNPNKKNVARAKQDNKDIAAARKHHSNAQFYRQQFIWPAKGPITGVYGSQRYFNGVPKRPHFGLDIAGPKGAEVVAPADGTITLTKDMFYSGNTILLDHGFGISSTFIHLDSITVKVGQKVKQGEKIGTIGNTGRVTGPHLDWRLNWFAERLDPHLLVKDIKQ